MTDAPMKDGLADVHDHTRPEPPPENITIVCTNIPLFFYGTLLIVFGLTIYFSGIVLSIFRLTLHLGEPVRTWNNWIIWYSGVPSTLGLLLIAADLAFLLPGKRKRSRREKLSPVNDRRVVVALTAYNDEQSIG